VARKALLKAEAWHWSFFVKSPSSKTYILPTGYGVSFAVVCIFLLAIAFASTNNAVYLLCFVMASLGVQSLIITNKNIENTQVENLEIPDFFADEAGAALVNLHNSSISVVESLRYDLGKEAPVTMDRLQAGERRLLRIPLAPRMAGRHRSPRLKISSDFPFYFSRSWKTYQREVEFYVYPPRVGVRDFSSKAFLLQATEAETQDDFKGHRDYRENDSPRSIDWKVSSRLQKTTVKEYDQQASKKIWLRWEDCAATSDYERLSQLSLWIDLAERRDYEYGVMLPHRVIEFNKGPAHKALCLRALL
jgi:uncharacterized protein (DUF58 family)